MLGLFRRISLERESQLCAYQGARDRDPRIERQDQKRGQGNRAHEDRACAVQRQYPVRNSHGRQKDRRREPEQPAKAEDALPRAPHHYREKDDRNNVEHGFRWDHEFEPGPA